MTPRTTGRAAMTNSTDHSGSFAAVVGAVCLAGGAIAGALITSSFNYLSHKADVDAKMIERGVGICVRRQRRRQIRYENGRST